MKNSHKFFFVGIGGISMSGLAKYLISLGYGVSGSDMQKNKECVELENMGVEIFYKHRASNLRDAEAIVVNSAIKENNPELNEAKKRGLIILSRSELLKKVSLDHKFTIAISGTHGKTTVTAMVAEIFYLAGLNPTVHLGGVSKNLKTNFLVGGKNYFITEACEYKNNFLSLKPDTGVVLNIEEDHLDFFKNKDNLINSFKKFVQNCNFSIIFDKFSPNLKNIGIINNLCEAKNITLEKDNKYRFECWCMGERVGEIKLSVFHKHNIMNALFAVSVAKRYGIKNKVIVSALENFNGVERRFEEVGELNGAKVVVDYAHHPREIESAINSAKKMTKGKLHVVFQPHTYSRTKKLFDDFIKCFDRSEKLYIFKTYSAREKFDPEFNSHTLYKAIKKRKECSYFANFEPMARTLKKKLCKNDTLLILGAGDIVKLTQYLFN